MKQAALFGGVIVGFMVLGSGGAVAADYQVCKSTYALCTTAKCTTDPSNSDTVQCACEVRTGFSVGSTPCEAAKKTSAGTQVRSRYFPIKSYARCANNRPWANCYDKECVVDPKDPSKATCTCSVKENEGDYVMVTNSYSAETCTIGLWSSATLAQLDEVTTFIETHGDLLPHFPLKVLNADADTLGSMTPSSAR
jgi:hypothetical protein